MDAMAQITHGQVVRYVANKVFNQESFQSCLVLSRHFLYRDPRNGDAYGSNIGLSIV